MSYSGSFGWLHLRIARPRHGRGLLGRTFQNIRLFKNMTAPGDSRSLCTRDSRRMTTRCFDAARSRGSRVGRDRPRVLLLRRLWALLVYGEEPAYGTSAVEVAAPCLATEAAAARERPRDDPTRDRNMITLITAPEHSEDFAPHRTTSCGHADHRSGHVARPLREDREGSPEEVGATEGHAATRTSEHISRPRRPPAPR